MTDSFTPEGSSFEPHPSEPATQLVERRFSLTFTGDSGEFFRIWIVNILLSLVTLGFYIPWAKVRTRRYFHAHTHLDGHSFDYLAKPVNILVGYVIVVVLYVSSQVLGIFNPLFTLGAFALYALLAPWLIFKAMRFKAHNTSYRNVRFEFHGTIGDAYLIFLGMALLMPLTFGFIFPYWAMKQKEYFYKNLRFGGKRFQFAPEGGEYYARYLVGGFISILLYGFFLLVMVIVAGSGSRTGQVDAGNMVAGIVFVVSYAVFLMGFVFAQIYVFVSIFNYNLDRLVLDRIQFKSKMKVVQYYWLILTNLVASVCSLGLLVPWAAIRRMRYRVENVELIHEGDSLGTFTSEAGETQSAIGDAAADLFDFEVGW